MKKRTVALLLAGSLFCCGAAGGCAEGKVRKDVMIGGVAVGGLCYREAAEKVREELSAHRLPLVVHSPAGDFPATLDYADNVGELVRTAKRGARLFPEVRRVWLNAEEEIGKICAACAKESVDARLHFSADGFTYTEGEEGIGCDYEGLLRDVSAALAGEGTEVRLFCTPFPPKVTAKRLRELTSPLSAYATEYAEGTPRADNIALAVSRLTGKEIGAGESFSFNEWVGPRTAENGFAEAPVIYDGEFVQGVGGGVCQASTTLFGAALRAGLEIVESHPHSLEVGYAPPSEDAMVSSGSDLVFRNPYDTPVYLLGSAEGGRVEFRFFGPRGKVRYEVESVILCHTDPPPAQIVEGRQNRTVRAPKQGLTSESYLLCFDEEGTLLSRTLVRRDSYAAVRGIFERVPAPATPEEILSAEQ